jgi:2-keto-3-deoxy-L-rhamnonate aldolase RhmA
VIDLEHTMLNLETAYTLIAITSAHGVVPVVRVPDHGPSTIQRVLDAGAGGVLVPHVDTPEQAVAVARAARFPPHGTRGSGATSRAGRWGQLPRADYVGFGNTRALCLPQLESVTAMRDAQRILSVDGVDGVLIGAADLSMEMGLAATDPQVTGLIDDVLATASKAGKPCGFALGADPGRARELAARGFGFLVLGNDTSMLAAAAATLVTQTRG